MPRRARAAAGEISSGAAVTAQPGLNPVVIATVFETPKRDERCDHFLEEMWYLWEDGKDLRLSALRAKKVADPVA